MEIFTMAFFPAAFAVLSRVVRTILGDARSGLIGGAAVYGATQLMEGEEPETNTPTMQSLEAKGRYLIQSDPYIRQLSAELQQARTSNLSGSVFSDVQRLERELEDALLEELKPLAF